MIELDVANPAQVSSPSMIQVQLGDPNKRMIICSGIAIPEYATDDDDITVRETVRVRLRITALPVESSTVHVALASIRNDESAFTFAVDDEHIRVDPALNEFSLQVSLALRGEDTKLHRFSYQVLMILADVPSQVSGRLIWSNTIFDASGVTGAAAEKLASPFVVRALAGPGSTAVNVGPNLAAGELLPTTLRRDGDNWSIGYEIKSLPIAVPLVVQFDLGSSFAGAGTSVHIARGSEPFMVTHDNYSFPDHDYEVSRHRMK